MNSKDSHNFLDKNDFEGLIGFGLNRKLDEDAVTYYLKKFSNNELIETIKNRLTDDELKKIFDMISHLLKKYLTQDEYHKLFLKKKI